MAFGIDNESYNALWSFSEKVIEHEKMELVDLEYVKQGKTWVLRFYIDKDGGVNVDDCAEISRKLSVHLDVEDIIPNKYVLEVSSPGLNRPLKKEKDFKMAENKKVKISLKTPQDGRKNFSGVLKEFKGESLTLETNDGDRFVINLTDIHKARLNPDIKI